MDHSPAATRRRGILSVISGTRGDRKREAGANALRTISITILLISLVTVAACRSNLPALSLLDSVDQGDAEQVQEHIDYGTDLDESFVPQGFPFAGASALHLSVLRDDAEITNLLLDEGAEIEIKSRDGFDSTPLIWAAYWGLPEMVELLVESGTDIKTVDAFGTSVIAVTGADNPFIAVGALKQFDESRVAIKQYLLGIGAAE